MKRKCIEAELSILKAQQNQIPLEIQRLKNELGMALNVMTDEQRIVFKSRIPTLSK